MGVSDVPWRSAGGSVLRFLLLFDSMRISVIVTPFSHSIQSCSLDQLLLYLLLMLVLLLLVVVIPSIWLDVTNHEYREHDVICDFNLFALRHRRTDDK